MTRRGGRDASEKRGQERQQAASDGVTSCSVKAFQFGNVGNTKKRKPAEV